MVSGRKEDGSSISSFTSPKQRGTFDVTSVVSRRVAERAALTCFVVLIELG